MWDIHFQIFGLDLRFLLFLLALAMVIFHKMVRPRMLMSEIFYRWFVLLPVSFGLFIISYYYCYILNLKELGAANFSLGLLALFSFNASMGFRVATAVAIATWFWLNAFFQASMPTFTFATAGADFWLNISLPLILLLSLINLRTIRV